MFKEYANLHALLNIIQSQYLDRSATDFYLPKQFFGVNTQRLCNSTWLSTAGVIFIDRLFCDTEYSGGGLRTQCFASGIFSLLPSFAYITLRLRSSSTY